MGLFKGILNVLGHQRKLDTSYAERSQIELGEAIKKGAEEAIGQYQNFQSETAALFEPYGQAGRMAQERLTSGLQEGGEFDIQEFKAPDAAELQQDPSYLFRLEEGQRALQRQHNVAGGTGSGATQKALLNYGQKAASQEYGNVFQRKLAAYRENASDRQRLASNLTGQSRLGFNADQQRASINQFATQNIGRLTQLKNQAPALGQVGAANFNLQGQISQNAANVANTENVFNLADLITKNL